MIVRLLDNCVLSITQLALSACKFSVPLTPNMLLFIFLMARSIEDKAVLYIRCIKKLVGILFPLSCTIPM